MMREMIRWLYAAALAVAYPLAAVAADGLTGATVGGGPATAQERQALRERCQADPEKCREELRAKRREMLERCKADPEKCRAERKARMERLCKENPERCREMQARLEKRRAMVERCKADPEKCRQEARARMEGRFKKADADGSGGLSRAEAEKAMPMVARHFDEIDANKDGQVTLEEIEAARKARQAARRDKAGRAPAAK